MIELEELRDAAQKAFPQDKLVPDRDASWELCTEMGWLMVRVPEELGGLGLGREASTAIHYEMGRVLASAPLIAAQLATQAMAASKTLAGKEERIENACAGEFTTTNLSLASVARASDGALSGTLPAVPDADMASHVLVCVDGLATLAPLDAPGVAVTERAIWDLSRRLFDVTLENCLPDPALLIAEGEEANDLASLLMEEMLLALAADCLGGASASLEMTIEYLKMRRQFERPLAMFQALKHRIADLKTQIVSTEALLWSRAQDESATRADFGALKTLAAEVYEFVTEEMIQLHGGIGLTEEHQCHLFMKRAMLNLALGGMPDVWQERAGRQALASVAAA